MEEKIKELFKSNKLHYDWYKVAPNIVEIYVDCGDWKHDHLFLENLMKKNGFEFLGKEVDEEDEDNGDDSFSAMHTYKYLNN